MNRDCALKFSQEGLIVPDALRFRPGRRWIGGEPNSLAKKAPAIRPPRRRLETGGKFANGCSH